MSFSAETKNELARVISNDDYCNMTELAAIVRLAGSIQIAGYRKLNLKITTELNSVARKVFKSPKIDMSSYLLVKHLLLKLTLNQIT